MPTTESTTSIHQSAREEYLFAQELIERTEAARQEFEELENVLNEPALSVSASAVAHAMPSFDRVELDELEKELSLADARISRLREVIAEEIGRRNAEDALADGEVVAQVCAEMSADLTAAVNDHRE